MEKGDFVHVIKGPGLGGGGGDWPGLSVGLLSSPASLKAESSLAV